MYQLFFFSLFSFVHFFLFFIFSTFSSHASNAQMYLIKINDYVLRNTNDCISCMKHENVKLSLSKNLHHVIVSRQRLRYTGRYRQLDISFLFFPRKFHQLFIISCSIIFESTTSGIKPSLISREPSIRGISLAPHLTRDPLIILK